ncbi:MAG TPA: restriction endonuclease subunit S [Faecalibacterium prausnitzii]|nr:restriction endonuclease subunit S [Faecalibacterium prausnitzii]
MKIKDICDLQNGRAFKPSDWGTTGLPIIRIQNLNDERAPFNYYSGKYNLAQEVDNGDLLFSWSGTPGTSFGAFLWNRGKGVLNQHIFKVIPKVEVEKTYLMYALNGNISTIISKAHGGVGLQHITKKELDEIEIQMVSISRQKEIVEILEKVSLLIFLRKQQLAKLDELVKARFVEMFGDPVSNPLHWKKVKLSELADIKIGPFGSLLHKEDYVTGGHPLVNPSHIINGRIIVDNDLTLTEEKYFELSAYHLKKNDVVLGRRGEMGRCAVVDEEGLLCGTGSLLIRTNGTVTADYIQKIISFPTFKKTIEDMAVGQTMPNLNVPIVSNFMIIVPPLSVQKDYYDFVERVDQQKQTVQQSLEKLELMKKALMQEYFG